MENDPKKLGLNSDNSVIIGSGILNALGIRKSHDIDVVTTPEIFNELKKSGDFKSVEVHSHEVLSKDLFEIGTGWEVLGKFYTVEDLKKESVVIGAVRYVNLDFLLKVKKSWVEMDKEPRQKDLDDVKLIEEYLRYEK